MYAATAPFVFALDTVDPTCEVPRLPNTCTFFQASRNKFRNLRTTSDYPRVKYLILQTISWN